MLAIALELARENPVYSDMAIKFFEHFLYIADAIDNVGTSNIGMWDEADGFYYSVLELPNGQTFPLKVRSDVGLCMLFAVETIEFEWLNLIPGLKQRVQWFLNNRPDLAQKIVFMEAGADKRVLLSIINRERLQLVMQRVLDETEFLCPYGIRSVSRYHAEHPFIFRWDGREYRVDYEPAESRTGDFGGNSNWRGPIWFPLNFLLIESLQKFHHYYGDTFKVECPTGSGNWLNLEQVAAELSKRLIAIFVLQLYLSR